MRQRRHANARRRRVCVPRESEIAVTRACVGADPCKRFLDRRRAFLVVGQRRYEPLDPVEKDPRVRRFTLQDRMDECHLLRGLQPVIDEPADLGAVRCAWIVATHARRHRHSMDRELREQLLVDAAAADVVCRRRLQRAMQDRPGGRAEWGDGREAIDRRRADEYAAHHIAIAFRVGVDQRARDALGFGPWLPSVDQRLRDVRGHALHALAVQRIAAEHVDLLQVREHAGARAAARRALHLRDRQVLADLQLVGEEVAAVEMTGDHQDIAFHLLLARRCEPVAAAVLDQFDEGEVLLGKVAAKRFALLSRVDGDRADGALSGVGRKCEHRARCGDGNCEKQAMHERAFPRTRMRALVREWRCVIELSGKALACAASRCAEMRRQVSDARDGNARNVFVDVAIAH